MDLLRSTRRVVHRGCRNVGGVSKWSLGFRDFLEGEHISAAGRGAREGEAGGGMGVWGPPCLEGLSVSPTVPHAELELSALGSSGL